MLTQQIKTTLKNVFGYDEFRSLQQEVIKNVLQHRDTLAIMPTGGGKSLCYQIPGLLFKGLTLVVSPLISLMEDQVRQLTALGVEAVVLNSSLSYNEYQENTSRLIKNEVRFLYLAPETLLAPKTLKLLSQLQVDCITIDEAHCISEWGHDFRPEYRQLLEVKKHFPKAVCVALTATATPQVQQDIKNSLQIEDSDNFIASFNRKNLFLQVSSKIDPIAQVFDFLKKFKNQSGIIYCTSRRQVDELAQILMDENFSVKPYHAGLSDKERQENQELFIRDDVQIMVATIAFGMGINKPNVRFVVHYDLPKNIESYYQQIGRAGRDGLPAHCYLLFGYGDIQRINYFILQKSEQEQKVANLHLNALIGLAETDECRRVPLLRYFGEKDHPAECEMCDNCLEEEHARIDVTIPAQKFLSCVKRTGETFGAGHVIDVLRASKAQKVMKYRHHELSTYGIGTDHSKKQWFYWSRQFIQKGLLAQDMEHGSLKLTDKAWEVLRGKQTVFAKKDERLEKPTKQYGEVDAAFDSKLFELLRQERKQLADDSNFPPYIVFSDKTLMEMATYFPQSQASFLQLHGVGSVKYKSYGNPFLDLLCDYCQKNHIEENPKHAKALTQCSSKRSSKRHVIVGEQYNSGKTIDELRESYKVTLGTILKHLYQCYAEGYKLRSSDELLEISSVASQKQNQVLTAFEELGADRLKPVFDTFNEELSYDDLRVLQLHYCIESQKLQDSL